MSNKESVKVLYRYDGYGEYAMNHPNKFPVISETEYGYWVPKGYFRYFVGYDPSKYDGEKRWVSKGGKKRFAYPTKEEALVNYIARKKSQIRHNKISILRAEMGLRAAGQTVESVIHEKFTIKDILLNDY